ncbi:MucR family transcriptional regulator [Beijerinckia sp. L45]|uniref:MucR family transcriptional regulator n=1 Tax=Beijerinckia sp. L45 TaxID=1641855 RepID=UPI00131BF085|nr:MucR family transcriptional regulator [Beijerinckia sp. L45]
MTEANDNVEQTNYLSMTADVVASYVSNNSVRPGDLEALIKSVYEALSMTTVATVTEEPQEPAVSVKKSITPEFLICLEDGKKFKSLKRHLATAYDMTPDDYRAKWSLPRDYPMVAPAYAAARSALAKQSGLGVANLRARKPAAAKVVATKGRGRPRKNAA